METTNQKAKLLASRPYEIIVEADQYTDGEPGFYASVRELPGCHGQGDTAAEALEDVKSAMVDYIEHYLDHGLPVPQPSGVATKAVSSVLFVNFLKQHNASESTPTTASVGTLVALVPA